MMDLSEYNADVTVTAARLLAQQVTAEAGQDPGHARDLAIAFDVLDTAACQGLLPDSWQDAPIPGDCMACGAHRPSGHVIVRDGQGCAVGRVCSSHSLLYVQTHASDKFMVDVTLIPDP